MARHRAPRHPLRAPALPASAGRRLTRSTAPEAASGSATLAGCAALALWAFLAPLTRLAQPTPPLLLTALGLAAGGLFGLAAVAARGRLRALRQGPLAWAHGVGGIGGYHALYFAALGTAPALEANLLNYAWPLLIVLFSGLVNGLPLGPQRLLGVAMGAAGAVLVLVGGGGGAAAFPAEAWLGFACALAASVVWAIYSVLAARLGDVPSEAVAGFCLVSAAAAGLAHLAFEPAFALEARHWAVVALMGLGPTGAAFFLWDHGMKRGDPRLLGTLAYAVPVASTLLLVLIGEGELSARMLLAAALVSGGGLLAALAGRRARRLSPG